MMGSIQFCPTLFSLLLLPQSQLTVRLKNGLREDVEHDEGEHDPSDGIPREQRIILQVENEPEENVDY